MSNSSNMVYSDREKMLLTTLVRENPLVEDKRADAAMIADKKRAWDLITRSFNSQPIVNRTRTSQQLRRLWINLKHRKRKQTEAQLYETLVIGDDPVTMVESDPLLELVSATAPNMDITMNSPSDSTHLFEKAGTTIKNETYEEIHIEECHLPSPSEECMFNSNDELSDTVKVKKATNPPRLSPAAQGKAKRLTMAIHQQRELHNFKKLIAEEELLKIREERKVNMKIMDLKLQQASHEVATALLKRKQAAAEADLAALKLEQFRRQMPDALLPDPVY
ncbi:myb/SANT-like DNA-binding domain-containing protein 3 isoform X3 [Sitophilus oryzae]|uniref:Regulatory protein zeste n=1 Tax=Sitophilus oryzae TaxID=7048 RepID=A0A6J2YET1_SITOR|nr:myb/SANT-like DNA-binding domain-containing protein 3 isoform X3 [Sitophilus oryzae]